jgi:glycosyltransferase involved in cell wall biosynthesis
MPARSVRKIGAVTTDWSSSVFDDRNWPALGGAGWARIGQVKDLSSNHWITGELLKTSGRIGVSTWDHRVHHDCEVIVMQRYMDAGLAELVRQARSLGQPIINDLDDWFWGLHKSNNAAKIVDPKNSPANNIDHYKMTLRASTAVVTSTPYLADRVREWGGVRVEVIPNGIDVRRFPQRVQRRVNPIIGWSGSTGHRSGDLALLREPFAALSGVAFHHTGHYDSYPSFVDEVGVSAELVTLMPMLAPHEYPHGLIFDIGVVPLVDIPFNHAKSYIKGLEYAAAGIPFVASPLPEYVRLVEQHGIGRLAKTSADWVRELTALLDYDTRVDEANRQRQAVTALSAKAQARAWDNLIWSL